MNWGCSAAARGLGGECPHTLRSLQCLAGNPGVTGHLCALGTAASWEGGAGWKERLQQLLHTYQGICLAAVAQWPHVAAKPLSSELLKPTQMGDCHPLPHHLLLHS